MKIAKNTLSSPLKVSLLIARLALAVVFIFSGFVKAVDPLGSTYKIEEYLAAFGPFFENFQPLALVMAVALITLEFVIGLNLLVKNQIRITALFALLFMCVMTPLTLYIYIANPVSDCGCFGDALVISNSATFYKNVVLLLLAIFLFCFRNSIHLNVSFRNQWFITAAFVFFSAGISVYCLRHLPIIDFLPYKKGVNIPEAMAIPDDAPKDVYKTWLIYEKDGVKKEFTIDDYPRNDSTWQFVDQKSILVSQGYRPAITDFFIIDDNYNDITEQILQSEKPVYLLIMYDVGKASEKGVKRAEEFYQTLDKENTSFYALSGSSTDDVLRFKEQTGVTYPFYQADVTTLKTIMRSNPGLLVIKEGTIADKLHWRDFENK